MFSKTSFNRVLQRLFQPGESATQDLDASSANANQGSDSDAANTLAKAHANAAPNQDATVYSASSLTSSTATAAAAVFAPTSPTEPFQSDLQSPPYARQRTTADEQRLVKGVQNTRAPSRSVRAPDPKFGYEASINTKSHTMGKPQTSAHAFQPYNTIAPNGTSKKSATATYSKHSRVQVPFTTPGADKYAGKRQANDDQSHELYARMSRDESPAKRRKMGTHRNPHKYEGPVRTAHNEPVDMTHDDDVQFTSSRPIHAVSTSPGVLSPAHSQHTSGSGSASAVSRLSAPPSGFTAVDDLTNTRQKKSRKKPSARSESAGVVNIDDEDVPDSTRTTLLKGLTQGESARPKKSAKETVSQFFPKPKAKQSSPEQKALQEPFRQAPVSELEADKIEYSDSTDELNKPTPPKRPHRKVTNPKAAQSAQKSSKQKAPALQPQRWSLKEVRGPGYDWIESEPDAGLSLHCGEKSWKVTQLVSSDPLGQPKSIFEINPDQIGKAWTDHKHRVRLESRRLNTGRFLWDFNFQCESDLKQFNKERVLSSTGDKFLISKTLETMQRIFGLPLQTSKPVSETEQQESKPESIFDDVTPWAGAASGRDQSKPEVTPLPGARSSTRPTRSTRNSGQDINNSKVDAHNDLTLVEKFSITHGLGPRWKNPFQFGSGRHRAVVHFEDLRRLDNDEFLNDSLIDFYMIYLFNKSKVSPEKIFFFNTYFYTALTKNTGRNYINYEAVKRWTTKDDIFSHDYIVVPINEDAHWYLAIICNVGGIARKPSGDDFNDPEVAASPAEAVNDPEDQIPSAVAGPVTTADAVSEAVVSETSEDPMLLESTNNRQGEVYVIPDDKGIDSVPTETTNDFMQQLQVAAAAKSPTRSKKVKRKPVQKRDPEAPIIVILDSLGSTRSSAVRALKEWLKAEGEARRSMDAQIKEKGFYPKDSQIPMQENFSDCGVFVLGYAQKFFQDPDGFKKQILTGEMSAHRDWPDMKPTVMREQLRNIIMGLQKEQGDSRKAEHKAKKEANKISSASLQPPAIDSASPATPDAAAKPETPQVAPDQLKVPLPEAGSTPRLASPFKSEPKPRSDSPARAEKASISPSASVQEAPPSSSSSGKVEIISNPPPASPRAKPIPPATPRVKPIPPTIKRRSPKVQVTNSPAAHSTHTPFGGSNGVARKRGIVSPVKDLDDDVDVSPIQAYAGMAREGKSDNPIEIQDSQEQPAPIESAIKRGVSSEIDTTRPVPSLSHTSNSWVLSHDDPGPEPMEIDSEGPRHAPLSETEVEEENSSSSIGIQETPPALRSSPVKGLQRH